MDMTVQTCIYLNKSGLDVFIIHKLRKNEELFPQELECEIYLKDNGMKSHKWQQKNKTDIGN